MSRSNGTTLSYDPLGRLWQASGPSGTARFLYDGDRMVQEYDGTGTPRSAYIHGPGSDEPLTWYSAAGRRHFHADHQGSIIAIADDAGNPVAINAYDEWGIPNAGNVGRFGYTGQMWLPDLGMWYYKARIYSPTLGRFLQTDPVGYKDQINLYAYVGNDPVNASDHLGLFRDIYIGGASDIRSEIVKSYVQEQRRLFPQRDILYFEWNQTSEIRNAIESAPFDEPLNLIGHSLGAAEAIRQANSDLSTKINNLFTMDPVDFPGPKIRRPYNIDGEKWTNVTARPAKWDLSDLVAWGGGKVSSAVTDQAGRSVSSGAHHAQFREMMKAAKAKTIIDNSYARGEEAGW